MDVYRQLLEQEPSNERARLRLVELESSGAGPTPRPAAVPDERASRRRALERTIAGLETLLAAVQKGSMTAFADALKGRRGAGAREQILMIMGTDGIPIEKLMLRADPNMEAVAAEYTTLLRASVSAAPTPASASCGSCPSSPSGWPRCSWRSRPSTSCSPPSPRAP